MYGLSLPHVHSGKVRDTFAIPGRRDLLLMVASDRISTHNVKHRSHIRDKGALLTALTLFWKLEVLKGVRTHIAAWGKDIYAYDLGDHEPDLHSRAIVVQALEPDPREFIWRSYLTGSLLAAYRAGEDPYGLHVPAGLPNMYRFPQPIFTPTMKSLDDEPVDSAETERAFPIQTLLTRTVFSAMQDYLHERGIELIDGKMEADGDILIDEWGTGDCCRMAFTKDMQDGVDPPWLDKEVFRQAAVRLWNGGPKVPLEFPQEVVHAGIERYHEAFEVITGRTLSGFQQDFLN